MFTSLIAEVSTTTQPVGETPWERVILGVAGIALAAWLGYLHSKSNANEKRVERQAVRMDKVEDRTFVTALAADPKAADKAKAIVAKETELP